MSDAYTQRLEHDAVNALSRCLVANGGSMREAQLKRIIAMAQAKAGLHHAKSLSGLPEAILTTVLLSVDSRHASHLAATCRQLHSSVTDADYWRHAALGQVCLVRPGTVAAEGRVLSFESWKAAVAWLEGGVDWLAESKGGREGNRHSFNAHFQAHQGPVHAATYSPPRVIIPADRELSRARVLPPLLATGGSDQMVKVWRRSSSNSRGYELCAELSTVHVNSITVLKWWEDGDCLYLLSGGADRKVVLWDLNRPDAAVATGRNGHALVFIFGVVVSSMSIPHGA